MNCFACHLVKGNFRSNQKPHRLRATALTECPHSSVKTLLHSKVNPHKITSMHLHIKLPGSRFAAAYFFLGGGAASVERWGTIAPVLMQRHGMLRSQH